MTSRRNRKSRTFGIESLEFRNAPSHFGIAAHAAAMLRPVHVAAQVKHFTDSEANHKKELTEKSSSVDSSQDSKDSRSTDPSSPDKKELTEKSSSVDSSQDSKDSSSTDPSSSDSSSSSDPSSPDLKTDR
jgi:hypothetical protein